MTKLSTAVARLADVKNDREFEHGIADCMHLVTATHQYASVRAELLRLDSEALLTVVSAFAQEIEVGGPIVCVAALEVLRRRDPNASDLSLLVLIRDQRAAEVVPAISAIANWTRREVAVLERLVVDGDLGCNGACCECLELMALQRAHEAVLHDAMLAACRSIQSHTPSLEPWTRRVVAAMERRRTHGRAGDV